MRARLAITGASGQLGKLVAERVLAQCAPSDVILATRSPHALADFAARGADVRHADFDEPRSLRDAFAGAERLLLISATDLHRRVAQHRAAIAAAEAAGVRRVIYTSGSRPEPPNPAAVAPSHHATEQALAATGLEWTVLRNSLYADYQIPEALHAIATGVLAHNRGRGRVAYVARDDCAAAAAAVLLQDGHDGAIYDITGAESYGAEALAALYSELGGKRVALRAIDDATFVAGLVGASTDGHLRYGAELLSSFGRAIREGYLDVRSDAVSRLTGREPRPLLEVLAPHLRGALGYPAFVESAKRAARRFRRFALGAAAPSRVWDVLLHSVSRGSRLRAAVRTATHGRRFVERRGTEAAKQTAIELAFPRPRLFSLRGSATPLVQHPPKF